MKKILFLTLFLIASNSFALELENSVPEPIDDYPQDEYYPQDNYEEEAKIDVKKDKRTSPVIREEKESDNQQIEESKYNEEDTYPPQEPL